jgi:hypothetical protein
VVYQGTRARRLLAASAVSLVFVLACAASADGQMTIGNRLNLALNGDLGTDYVDTFGNGIGNGHNLGLAANGILDGYYFRPQFLSFQVRPYYDRAQSNAESQTITRGSGVDSSVSLFGGSHFPGSISYGRDFSSNSEFSVAGVPSVLGNSSSSNFNVAWSALFSGYPSLYASYSIADSTSTLLGTTSQSTSSSRNLNLNSNYDFGGFSLHGSLNHYNTDFLSPSFLTASTISNTSSSTDYGITATRRLPLSGYLGLGWSRTSAESGNDKFTSDSYSALASFSPWHRLSISGSCNYTTDIILALAQSLGYNTVAPLVNPDSNQNSSAIYMNTTGTFTLARGVTVSGQVNHQIEHFQGRDLENTQYGGTINLQRANNFFGFLRFSVGIVDVATQEGNNGVGLVANLNMTRKFGRWETAADISYSQNTETLYAIATTNNYSYGGTLRRKINPSTYWSTSFRESRSGLSSQEGSSNVSDSFTTSLSWNRYSFSGNYSKSSGAALLGANGTLTATPLGSIISNDFLTIDARSFGVNASTRLFRALTVGGGYTKVSSSTIQQALGTFNRGDRYNAYFQLRLRRLNILGGFDRAVQEASTVPGGPLAINSFYVSLARWFKIF